MSQSGPILITSVPPFVATIYAGNVGSATPAANTINLFGATIPAGSEPFTSFASGNTVTFNVQLSQAIGSADATKVGLSAFDSASFNVDADGFVTLIGGGTVIDSIAVQTGTSPVVPTGAGLVTINGSVVAAGTNPIRTDGTSANSLDIEVQISQALGAADATKIGLSNFDNSSFAVDTTGFVTLSTTGVGKTITGDSGGSLSPIANNWNLLGSGSITTSGVGATLTTSLTGLTNHAVLVGAGTATITKLAVGSNGQVLIGATAADPAFATLTSSDSSISFTTGVNTLSLQVAGGTTVGKTITGDSGGALSPTSGNWNLLGRSGSKTSGSGSTLTINSPPYADQGGSTSVTLNSGSFSTATITLTTPVTAGLLDGDLLEFVATTANPLTIQFAATQVGHIGNVASSVAGTFVSTAIGDAVSLRYQVSTNDWWATSVQGNWTIT